MLDDTGDLKLADPSQTVIQDIEFRVRSQHWDYQPDPYIGANLKKYQGKQNTETVGDAIREAVYYSLVQDGRFQRSDVFVDVIPLSINAVAIFVIVQDWVEGVAIDQEQGSSPLRVDFVLTLDEGLITRVTGVEE